MGSRMRKLFTVGSSLALAVAVFLGMTPRAEAGNFYAKHVNLSVVRNSAGTDNPFVAAGLAVTASNPIARYTTAKSDGNHNAANLGVAVGVEDTTDVIDVRDHWLNSAGAYRPNSLVQTSTQQIADSTWFGDLILRSNSATIDTVTYFRDVSVDGVTFTPLDSLQGHIVSDRLALTLGAVSDSARIALATVSNAAGTTGTSGGIEFNVIPGMGRAGVTALATQGVRFIRFRWHMTPGDFAAAGTSKWISAEFVYPASDADPSHPQPNPN